MLAGSRSFVVNPELWKILVGVGLFLFTVIIYRRTMPPLSTLRRAVLTTLRILAFALLVCFMLDPGLVRTAEEVRAPLLLVLFDVSKSMSVRDPGERSRRDEAVSALGDLLASLDSGADVRVEIVPFASDLYSTGVGPDSIPAATGEGTDILGSIRETQRRYRGENVSGIVLMTDGRISRGMTTTGSELSVPVYAVGFGDTLEKPDVRIADVHYERVTYAGTENKIEVRIDAVGFAGRTVALILGDADRELDRVRLQVGGDREELAAVFDYTPEREGDYVLTAQAVPLVGEERTENNEEQFRVTVLKDMIRVLFLDELADWNTTFIRSLAERSRRIEVEAVTWIEHRGHVMLPERRPWRFPATRGEFDRYDLVVIADDTILLADQARVEAIEAYVEAGGSLLLLADEHSLLVQAAVLRPLEPVLPVRITGQIKVIIGEYAVRVPAGEWTNPVAAALAESARIDELPPLPAYVSGLTGSAAAAVPLTVYAGGAEHPLLAIHRHGEGVSAVVLGFPLWRWKLANGAGSAAYHAFFGGLFQYLAEGADEPTIELDTDRTVYRSGDRVRLTVHVRGGQFLEGVRGEIYVKEGGETPLETFLFVPDPRRTGIFTADLDPLPPGEYRIVATEIRPSGSGSPVSVEVRVTPVSVEFISTSRDVSFMRYVTSVSGGAVIERGELSSLPNQIVLEEDRVATREVSALREHPLLFIGVILLLASEWVLRKAWGLV